MCGAKHPPRLLPVFVATIAVCFYIGYFGAGAGFLIITLLSLFGFEDLHEINALKVVATTMANGIAFVLFVVNGQVVWRYCLLAMGVSAIGGYSSARYGADGSAENFAGAGGRDRAFDGGLVLLEAVKRQGPETWGPGT